VPRFALGRCRISTRCSPNREVEGAIRANIDRNKMTIPHVTQNIVGGGGLIPNQDEQNAQAGESYPSRRRETSHSGVGLGIRFWSTIQR
jgi:hypothetical protein